MAILDDAEIAALIGLSPTEQMEALIPAAEAWVQRECNCYVQTRAADVYDGSGVQDVTAGWIAPYLITTPASGGFAPPSRVGSTLLELRRWPIIEDDDNTIELRIAVDSGRSFTLVDPIDRGAYYLDLDQEFPVLLYDAGFPPLLRCVQLTCTAGYPVASYPEPEKALIAEFVALTADQIGSGAGDEHAGGYGYHTPIFADVESQLSAMGRATLENGRARSNIGVR